jgi:hypothetical protein
VMIWLYGWEGWPRGLDMDGLFLDVVVLSSLAAFWVVAVSWAAWLRTASGTEQQVLRYYYWDEF